MYYIHGNKFITMITIPIENYYGDDIFILRKFFIGERSPSKTEVLNALEIEHQRNLEIFENGENFYSNDEGKAIEIVKMIYDWKHVHPSIILQTNVFIKHPKFDKKYPFVWEIMNVLEF